MYNQWIWRREGTQGKYYLCFSFTFSSSGIISGLWAKLQLLFCYANRNYMLSHREDHPTSLATNIFFHFTFNSSRSEANSVTKFLICMIYINTYISPSSRWEAGQLHILEWILPLRTYTTQRTQTVDGIHWDKLQSLRIIIAEITEQTTFLLKELRSLQYSELLHPYKKEHRKNVEWERMWNSAVGR